MEPVENVQTVEIRADSSATVEINKKWFKVSYGETRIINNPQAVDMNEERQKIWDTVNGEVDTQIQDIMESFKN